MDIIPDLKTKCSERDEIESVQEKQDEYSIVGTAYRRRGTRLWSYDPKNDTLKEIVPEKTRYLQTVIVDGILMPKDDAEIKAMIDTRCEIFEAINERTANTRVQKYKSGKLSTLNNLRTSEGKLKLGFNE